MECPSRPAEFILREALPVRGRSNPSISSIRPKHPQHSRIQGTKKGSLNWEPLFTSNALFRGVPGAGRVRNHW